MPDAVIGSAYLQVVPKLDEGALKSGMASAGKSGSDSFSNSFKGGMSAKAVAIGNIMSNAILKGVDVASKAASEVFVEAFESYANYEQLAGGVQKIFNDMDTSQVFKDANNAWRDLNMSANDYMATINDVGAMFSATMSDQAAYDAARKGMQAISDYASGTGKNLDLLNEKFAMITRSTSSYQSIADQFSGILPATSKSFLEQAQAAGLLSDSYKSLTEVPIDEYQQALVGMLEEGTKQLGLYGNTAAETANTISGSVAGMKSAWQNWLTGIADENADMGQLTDDLVEAVGNVINTALPRIQVIAERIGPAVTDAIGGIFDSISPEAGEAFDSVADAAGRTADGLGRIAEQTAASGVLQDVAGAFSDIAEIISSADFGPIFDTLASGLNALKDFVNTLELNEAQTALRNMGEIPDVANPQTWHQSTEAVLAWDRQVKESGLTVEEYRKLTDREMTEVSRTFENNGNNLAAALESVGYILDETTGKIIKYDSQKLADKYAKVDLDDNQLVDAQGHVYTWNGTDLVDKDGNAVVDDVALVDAQGRVYVWNGTNLESKSANVNVSGASALDSIISMWESWVPSIKSVQVNASSALNSFFGDAAGGFYKLHASGGFITNGPVNLGVDRYGVSHIAGEAGREWIQKHADGTTSIVPIENRKHLEPYASTIASMIGGGGSYNVTIYAQSGDPDAIAKAFTREVEQHKRLRGGRSARVRTVHA